MKLLGSIALVAACFVVGYFLYEPKLSPEAADWMRLGKDHQARASSHEPLVALNTALKNVIYPAGDCQYIQLDSTCLTVAHEGLVDVDLEVRARYRKALEAFPYKTSSLVLPDNGALISGMSYDYAADLFQEGQIQSETLLFNLRSSRKALRNANSIFDHVIAVGLYQKALTATAFTLVESPQLLTDELKEELKPIAVDASALIKIGQSELAMAENYDYSESGLARRKQNWMHEEMVEFWTQYTAHYHQSPEQFWTDSPGYTVTSYWRYIQYRLMLIAAPAYQDYSDSLRKISLTSSLTASLAEEYAGGKSNPTEVFSPEGWKFEHHEEQLCLVPEFRGSRLEEYCLTNLKRQIAKRQLPIPQASE